VKPERQIDWERLKTIALSLGLPGIEETTSRGQPTLKVSNGKQSGPRIGMEKGPLTGLGTGLSR
jgi:hypothetical protein